MKPIDIILNCLPPAASAIPSIALSSLKSHLTTKGVESKIVYWNILLNKLLNEIQGNDWHAQESKQLLPFLYLLYDYIPDDDKKEIFQSSFQLIYKDRYLRKNQYNIFLNSLRTKITQEIDNFYSTIDINNVKLIGFSSKFNQWVPALFFAKYLKSKYPNIKLVIGGFCNKASAIELMNSYSDFDFAIWGEGEIPLYELYNNILNSLEIDNIPRLIYRENNEIIATSKNYGFVELNDLCPDYDDYFQTEYIKLLVKSENSPINILINSIRGCSWNRCKFCILNKGYKYREADIDFVVKLIEEYYDKYGVNKFQFVNNDTIGKNFDSFDYFLDQVINLNSRKKKSIFLYSEIIPIHFGSSTIKKMKIAGFENIQIGFEALTDNLLAKMDKKTRFADSIFFLKFALKYGIQVSGINVIRGIPGETKEDVYESINNLHFLRFLIGKEKFQLNPSTLAISEGSKFYIESDDKTKQKYKHNLIYELLPQNDLKIKNRFNIADFVSLTYPNFEVWKSWEKVYNYYLNSVSNYKIFKYGDVFFYREYHNENLTNAITFDNPLYWEILTIANDEVGNFENLYKKLTTKFNSITESQLKEYLYELKSEYLIYYSQNYEKIISIIDINNYI